MTAKATKKEASAVTEGVEDEVRHYSPEEVRERGLLPIAPRTLREKAYARQIPHSKAGGRITFRLKHLREIAEMYDVRPIGESKPTRSAA